MVNECENSIYLQSKRAAPKQPQHVRRSAWLTTPSARVAMTTLWSDIQSCLQATSTLQMSLTAAIALPH